MNNLRVAFAKILLNTHGKKVNLVDYSYTVLHNTKPEKISSSSSTIVSFLDIQIKDIKGTRCLVGAYGYALGDKYRTIDPTNKTISQQEYPTPPFQGEAIFLLMESGYIVFEEKSSPYIEPEKIKDALENAFRSYAIEVPVKIQMLELLNTQEVMIEFVQSLKKLFLIEFSNLRHSNPSEKSKFFDEASNARIDDIVESTINPDGIDRNNDLFKNQLSHVQNSYGKIRKAEGLDDDGFRAMELKDDKIRLTADVENQDSETKLNRMIGIFYQILSRLSINNTQSKCKNQFHSDWKNQLEPSKKGL